MESLDRTTFSPFRYFLARSIGVVAHSFRMRPRTVCLAFEKRRPFSCACSANCFPGCAADRLDVIAIDLNSRDVVSGSAARHVGIPGGISKRHFCSELVVLADEQHWEFPDARQIQSFMESSIVH